MKGTYLYIIKTFQDKPTANIVPNKEKLDGIAFRNETEPLLYFLDPKGGASL